MKTFLAWVGGFVVVLWIAAHLGLGHFYFFFGPQSLPKNVVLGMYEAADSTSQKKDYPQRKLSLNPTHTRDTE